MFIFSSTFNLLHHFKMRQAFVFTLVIVLISQFNRDQATELLIESAESRLLDLRVAGSTDVHNSSDGPHEICKQLHQDGFQLSMNANGPSIKSLCDGFKNKQEGKCIVGRCECPEERQFCTNNADSKKKFQKPIIYNDPTEQFGKTMKVPTKKSSAYESKSEPEILAGKDDFDAAFITRFQAYLDRSFIVWVSIMLVTAILIALFGRKDWAALFMFIVVNGFCFLYFNYYYYLYGIPEMISWVDITVVILLFVFVICPFVCGVYRILTTDPRHNHAIYQPEPLFYSPVQPRHGHEPRPRRRRHL
ncbi:uncharacterized protein LOC109532875 isoform X2 [Dendroctonus ponderosae]|uniref:Uncharacterized protein n=1 Tax=Dendroctonus ponderosae TaxID=77166 RepID=A0AAR5NY70_DENPD|nr:uncharacterized protein LOC109532875 isoform X2 [Dendroctonus ponderosae]XP_048526102.1 uncharacterized protein LOC109532875 isoform X2 [Dendroctonus ponderosae]